MRKTALLSLLVLLTTAQTAWAENTLFSGGTGTQADPYLISSVDDWDEEE